MKTEIFRKLINNVKRRDFDLGTLSMTSKLACYEISFYGEEESGFDLIVEDFGRMYNNNWEQMQPTLEQLKEMQSAIYKELNTIEKEKETQRIEEVEATQNALDIRATQEVLDLYHR